MIVEHSKRSNNKLTLPRLRTEIGRMTLKFRSTILWNSLSKEDRDKIKDAFKETMNELKEKINNITFDKGTTTKRFRNRDYVYF